MISVFEYQEYRGFISDRFAEMPKQGYGQSRRLAEALEVHTTLISQILKGTKSFTLEQAAQVCDFFGLNDLESEYFLLLVQIDRAGNESLKQKLKKQSQALLKKSKDVSNRIASGTKLSEEMRAIFYSDWAFSAIRQKTALPGLHTVESLSQNFLLPPKRVREILDFLLRTGLCVEKSGELRIGPSSTFIEADSPWARLHHWNWRQQALTAMNSPVDSKIHYTSPMTLSKSDALVVREMIVQFLKEVDKVLDPSPSEQVHCLNIDWFQVDRN